MMMRVIGMAWVLHIFRMRLWVWITGSDEVLCCGSKANMPLGGDGCNMVVHGEMVKDRQCCASGPRMVKNE